MFGMTQDTLLPLAASHVFHRSAGVYGLFASAMATGTLAGAILAAHRAPYLTALFGGLPSGAPLIGWLAQTAGTRTAATTAGALTLAGVVAGLLAERRATR